MCQTTRAYNLLGATHYMDVWHRSSETPNQSLALAFKLTQKALAIDNSLSSAHRLLCSIYQLQRKHEKASAEGEKALTLNPNSADGNAILGRALNYTGRPEEAIPLLEKALRLSPIPRSFYLYTLGFAYNMMGRYEEGIEACKKAISLDPKVLWSHVVLTQAYHLSGREEEARVEVKKILRMSPNFSLDYFAMTVPFKSQADKDRMFGALRRAGLK